MLGKYNKKCLQKPDEGRKSDPAGIESLPMVFRDKVTRKLQG
jgi:hypothetical protein